MKKKVAIFMLTVVLMTVGCVLFVACSDSKIVVYGAGFDVSDPITSHIENDNVMFTMQQNPSLMGSQGMQTAIQLLKDPNYSPENANVDTGVSIYDKDTLETKRQFKANEEVSGKVYLITMDLLDEHWKRVDQGVKGVATDYPNVNYIWQAPTTNSDAAQQSTLIEQATGAGANVIMLAAADPAGTKDAVEAAMAQGVKFIYVDSPSAATGAVQTLSTDNRAAGVKAGEEFVKRLNDKGITSGKIYVLRPDQSNSVALRGQGFIEAAQKAGFTVVENNDAGKDHAKATESAKQAIAAGAIAIFGTNEGTTVGIGNAISEL